MYRVTQVRTPEGKNIYYTYDGYGRQSKRITPDAGQTDFIYDINSNLIYSQDANQRNINSFKYTFRNYDGMNRLTGIGESVFDSEDNPPGDEIQFVPTTASSYLTVNVYDTISNSLISNFFTGVSGYASALNFTKGNLAATAYRTRSSDSWNFKYYRYDVRGRVIKLWNIISDFDTLITEYYYNSQDQITKYSHSAREDIKTYRNTYDYTGRLYKVEYYTGSPDVPDPEYTNLTEYEYTENSQVSQQQYNNGTLINNFYYNNRNWISEMQNSNEMFNYTNNYFKNGNVKSQSLEGSYKDNFSYSNDLTFNYSYDKSNRLLLSSITGGKSFELENSYDKSAFGGGNILTLKRHNNQGSLIDNFSYNYYSGTNKLQKITGTVTQYTYDSNGNMISDKLNKNESIQYDHRNLITELQNTSYILNDSLIILTKYYYDEAGNRIRKMSYNTLKDSLVNDEIYSRDISGRELAIYKNNFILEYPTYGLDMTGKIKDEALYFYMKDHLGSVRAVIEDYKIVSSQDYDAWGYILQDRTYDSDDSKFKFTGKERDDESKYDYFGARYYACPPWRDARVGRWGQVEPLLDKYPSISSYVYSLANPLTLFDPNGKDVKAISIDAQQMILNTLPTEIQGNIVFNTEGLIDRTSLNSINASSENLEALKQLVNDSRLFEVSIASEFTYANESGDFLSQEFGPIEIDNSIGISPFGAQTGETGFVGQTLIPGSSVETFNSSNNSIHIVINEALSNRGKANTYSHEAYGHAFLYSIGKDYSHKIENINGEFVETNEELSKQIIRSINETEKNRRDK